MWVDPVMDVRSACMNDIRAAYKRFALQLHPDVTGNHEVGSPAYLLLLLLLLLPYYYYYYFYHTYCDEMQAIVIMTIDGDFTPLLG